VQLEDDDEPVTAVENLELVLAALEAARDSLRDQVSSEGRGVSAETETAP
jgi:hypothetical protein